MKYIFVVGLLLGTYHLFYSICFSTGIAKNAKIIVRYLRMNDDNIIADVESGFQIKWKNNQKVSNNQMI